MTSGVYPASVTPFDARGAIDLPALARLFAWFKAGKCQGVVLAGTNGEGPSLSAVEKRDMLKAAVAFADGLEVVLGVATPSLDEAIWLCKQAGAAQAEGVLLMPPGYFRDVSDDGVARWRVDLQFPAQNRNYLAARVDDSTFSPRENGGAEG